MTVTEMMTTMREIHFGIKKFDRRKLLLFTAGALVLYYNNYIYKQPCMILYNTEMQWLNEILNGH